MRHLTIVYLIPDGADARELVEHERMTAVSWSHAIHDRDNEKREAERLADELATLRRVLKASVELVCAPAWAGVSDEDCELERVLRECGYVTPNVEISGGASQPSAGS